MRWIRLALPVLNFALTFLLVNACGGSTVGSGREPAGTPVPADNRAEQIVAEYLKRDAAPFRKNRVRFTITEEGEPVKVYEIDSLRKQSGDETTTFTQIVSPPEDSGLGSLTFEGKGKETVVVTYSASRGEFRETGTDKMFFGGLTAGELLGEWNKFDYKLLGEREIDGRKDLEIEGRLKTTSDSLISRMTVIFRADNYLPVELHLFGAKGQEIRSIRTTKISDGGGRAYSARIEIDNLVYKTHIVIERLTNEFPEKIDDSMFVREKLKETVKN